MFRFQQIMTLRRSTTQSVPTPSQTSNSKNFQAHSRSNSLKFKDPTRRSLRGGSKSITVATLRVLIKRINRLYRSLQTNIKQREEPIYQGQAKISKISLSILAQNL